MERQWNQPSFALEGHFPWLPEARQLLESGESYKLEHLLLDNVWRYYNRRQARVAYSFPDVWLYLMKWDLVERWCSYDRSGARAAFENLVNASLEEPLAQLGDMG